MKRRADESRICRGNKLQAVYKENLLKRQDRVMSNEDKSGQKITKAKKTEGGSSFRSPYSGGRTTKANMGRYKTWNYEFTRQNTKQPFSGATMNDLYSTKPTQYAHCYT